ncbi:zinc finger BED domain-containing protein RICESLEEPER 2-like [Tripterygium wilfordii]|uniref:zinc finger BED domain-containing protein RICESLEEPER 2-like n=1 Tax=Tripterygium wilfordii TaxID=458696 RepID=UPI0018F8292E|nr:zinc finger BED domain-containing protein RICESLEEPER 2-like [Tripterygium wilfordii]XP_038686230.1 zinc finger BED domain-containing protein RICESLEEPER 2-like [Tripterygium wilfordii]
MGNDPPNPTEGNIINKQQEADPGTARKVSEPTKIETSRKRSWVWDFFTEVTTANGKRRATCDFCSKSYAADPKQNGTTSLGNHLVNVCLSSENPFREKEIELEKGQTTLNFEPVKPGETLSSLTQFNPVRAKKALACMIVKDELPSRFVQGEGFREFLAEICPKWKNIPSRITISRECILLYEKEKSEMKKAIKGQRFCLTTDTWTSVQNMNYMCLTGHFIDSNWKMHKRILNFCQVENHKGSTLGKAVETCLLEWGIDKILTLTVDNASSNNLVIDFLKKKTQHRKGTILRHEFLHLRCCAHILNLIVTDGLKDMDECITKVRNAVKYVRSSPQRLKAFKLCAEK